MLLSAYNNILYYYMQYLETLIFKVIIIGNSNSGKSALLNQITGKIFDNSYCMTIGVDFSLKKIELDRDNKKINIKLQIWDTAGQESFRSITRSYYREAAGVIVVFDLTNLQSYESLAQWIDDVEYYCSENKTVIVCGNKLDLNNIRVKSFEEIACFCKGKNIVYLETSSKSGENVDILFRTLAELIYDNYVKKTLEGKKIYGVRNSTDTVKLNAIQPKKLSCCSLL